MYNLECKEKCSMSMVVQSHEVYMLQTLMKFAMLELNE